MPQIDIMTPSMYPDGLPAAAELTAWFRAVEDLGFGGIWSIDRLFHQVPTLEGYTTLTWAAACTSRVRLGTAVLLMPLRNPALLAREVATLDALSGGRVTLGISLGGRENEHATIRATYRQRVRRLEESVEVLRRLFAGPDASFEGRYYQLVDATITPRPARGANLPIWLGTGSPAGLDRAGRIADGWAAGSGGTPDQFAVDWQRVRASAQSAGRSPEALQNSKLLYIWIDDDVDKARKAAERFLLPYYGERYDMSRALLGSAESCAERLRAYIDAGVQTLTLAPTGLDLRQLETISNRLMPLLR